jgi:hypothetical protein
VTAEVSVGGRVRGVALVLALVLAAVPAGADPVDCEAGLASRSSADRPHGIDAAYDTRPWAPIVVPGHHYDLRGYWIGEPEPEQFTFNLRVTDLAAVEDLNTVVEYQGTRTITIAIDHLGRPQFTYGHIEQSASGTGRAYMTDGTTTGSLNRDADVISVAFTPAMLAGVGDTLDVDAISTYHRPSLQTGVGSSTVVGPGSIVDDFLDGVHCRAVLRQSD